MVGLVSWTNKVILAVDMNEVVFKFLQGNAVTQTMLCLLIIYPNVANFL